MTSHQEKLLEGVLTALRRIMRAFDIHSRKLAREFGLTAPQLLILQYVAKVGETGLGALARRTSLSGATISGIVDRLEKKQLLQRSRGGADRRQVTVTVTDLGREVLSRAPIPLQEKFVTAMEALDESDRQAMLASLERIAGMMDAEQLDASQVLSSYPIMTSEAVIRAMDEAAGEGGEDGAPGASESPVDPAAEPSGEQWRLLDIHNLADLPRWVSVDDLAFFLQQVMRPYEDALPAVRQGILDALAPKGREKGFVVLAAEQEELLGALVMQRTGMSGYVPENILLFVGVHPRTRGMGVGTAIIERAQSVAHGAIKLHVEQDNPAKRLYERLGFVHKYAEMRYER